MIYLSLFLTSLVAATLFPLSSEALLATLVYQQYSWVLLWMSATFGNTFGACVNWFLGLYALHWQDKKWFLFKKEQLQRAQTHFQHYGLWSLLFAWVPIVGDPLTLLAGVMRVKFWQFFLLVLLGKAVRYALIIVIAFNTIAG